MSKKKKIILGLIIFVVLLSVAMSFYQFRAFVCVNTNHAICIDPFLPLEKRMRLREEAERKHGVNF